jgi:hypothetical protein
MKRLLNVMVIVAVMAILGTAMARAVEVAQLTDQEAALNNGANVVVVIRDEDLTTSTTNTAQTLTNMVVAANTLVEFVKMELRLAFEDDATNAFSLTTLAVGDGTDTDLYMSATELNKNGTEVYASLGRGWELTTTNLAVLVAGGSTNTQDLATAITQYGQKLYTSADTVDFTFTPSASYALSVLDKGEVRLFFKLTRPTIQR